MPEVAKPGLLLPFGTHSHWLQPWQAYAETVPATTFLDGLGMNLNLDGQDPDLVLRMLATNGIRQVRLEICWGYVNYDDETRLNDAARFAAALTAAKKYGLRPLILLNANQGLPCPTQFGAHLLPAGAPAGVTTMQLDGTYGLRPGYSGLSNLTGFWAAEDLITAIVGNTVTLSKPLPAPIPPGATVYTHTLKYRPFSVPGSADYAATLAGWDRYVGTVAAFATGVLSTGAAADKGFDLEVWNELTFGSAFLDINSYYAGHPYQYDTTSIERNLVQATADYLDAHPDAFSGVRIGDGFANTSPWQASSTEPARISAIDKHPYPPRLTFPRDEPPGQALNALGQPDPYIPSYSVRFPEYYATGIQTETIVRDMGPLTSAVAGVLHGRYAPVLDGRVLPTTTWITEVNIAPNWDNPTIDRSAALALKAKTTARFAAFFLNKGATRLYFYGAAGGDTAEGMVLDTFLHEASRPGATYPADDSADTSPALAVLQRMAAQMRGGLDPALTFSRPIQVLSISDTHNHYQFPGDGTAAHPPLYDRDVLAVLPYQVNSTRFVIPYYVMTRDVTRPLAPEPFTIALQGLHGAGASVSAYDPIRDTAVPVTVLARGPDVLTLQVIAADYPYLLTIQEGPAAAMAPRG